MKHSQLKSIHVICLVKNTQAKPLMLCPQPSVRSGLTSRSPSPSWASRRTSSSWNAHTSTRSRSRSQTITSNAQGLELCHLFCDKKQLNIKFPGIHKTFDQTTHIFPYINTFVFLLIFEEKRLCLRMAPIC